MTIGSLFSGIGGLELGLEWAGLGPVKWQVENDAFCRRVLERHWPDAERFDDVRNVSARELEPVDVVCGGFPCQDISLAGRGDGIDGARSGLWSEFARIVGELRPRFVVVENVATLVTRGLDRVFGDLAEGGYDAIWFPLRASDIGASHRRERIFIVAHANGREIGIESKREPKRDPTTEHQRSGDQLGNSDSGRLKSGREVRTRKPVASRSSEELAHTAGEGRTRSKQGNERQRRAEPERTGEALADTHQRRLEGERSGRIHDGVGSPLGHDSHGRNRPFPPQTI